MNANAIAKVRRAHAGKIFVSGLDFYYGQRWR